ncbi:hypothetical protein ACQJBY_013116 [Aegilops geniculata]
MDLAMGAMGSLLRKLGEVIKDEYKLQKGVTKKVKSFSAELDVMHAALVKVAEVPRDQLDQQVMFWANDVRDLSYDMEDVVDSLLVRVEGCDPNANQASFKKLMAKMANVFKKGKARHQISSAIKEIHQRLQDVTRRHERYNLTNLPAAATRTTVDPLLEALYGDKKNIIGLEKARDDIIKKITDGDSKQLKTLSIVGFGGLGKTTLAKEVYDALPTKFDYKAFLSVSRNPDLKKVLSNLLFELNKTKHSSHDAANLEVWQLIKIVQELLSKKRYFIIIDDLWNKEAWTTIRYALSGDECGSIIITTTRLMDVSKVCCSSKDDMIHEMKSLSVDDSQNLFNRRIFSSEVCPSGFEQVSIKILKKCAGVPLAIISLASYLANNQRINQIDQWNGLLNSIGRGLQKGDDHVKQMKRILSLSFYDLPPYLKTCFLYLCIFPEDHKISRDRLIRRWACEGFIQVEDETTSLLERGDSYFNELVNRNMIQPIHVDGRVEACCVHDIMLDLICELSGEVNFVTILDVIKGDTPLEKNFRRLSIQKSMTDLTTTQMATTSMPQVRSFTAFTPAISKIPRLSIFQVLRVLDLEGCDLRTSPGVDLRHVENLLHLRYLGLRGTKVGKLPMEIGKLQFLQTLDLQWTNSEDLPSGVVQLKHLMCLILDLGMPLPNRFSNLTCLEQLTGLGVGLFSADSAKELGCLIGLRELAFKWGPYSKPDDLKTIKSLIESLGKLHKLESLEISSVPNWVLDLMLELGWVPSPNLRRLKLVGRFWSLPAWICSSSLPLLSYLDLTNSGKVHSGDIQILGMLPALNYVNFSAPILDLVLSSSAFPNARVCLFHKILLVHSTFEPGAMRMVQRLRFGLRVNDILSPDFDLSIRNLPSLQHLRIDLLYWGVSTQEYSRAMDVLRRVADEHPKSPTLRADKY